MLGSSEQLYECMQRLPEMTNAKISRRAFIGLGAAAIGTGLAGAYSYWFESEWLELRHQRLGLGGLPQGLRILQLTDLHWSSAVTLQFIETAIGLGLSAKPDLIVLTGDFITTGENQPLDEYQQILKALSDYAPTYAVLGNHDGGRWSQKWGGYDSLNPITALLRAAGIRVLANSWQAEVVGQSKIAIVGVGDLWGGSFAPDRAFAGLEADRYGLIVLLAHNPDTKDDSCR